MSSIRGLIAFSSRQNFAISLTIRKRYSVIQKFLYIPVSPRLLEVLPLCCHHLLPLCHKNYLEQPTKNKNLSHLIQLAGDHADTIELLKQP